MDCRLASMRAPLSEPRIVAAEVAANDPLGGGVWRIVLRASSPLGVEPAQFAMIRCSEDEAPAGGPLLRRPFSVADILPGSGGRDLVFLHRVVGAGTAWLAGRKPGDPVSLVAPLGRGFRPGDAPRGATHLLVAGGIGIAPFPLLARRLREAGERAILLFGGRTAADLAARSAFDELGIEVRIATEDGSAGLRGRVTDLLAQHFGAEPGGTAAAYSCGPAPMLAAVERVLRPPGVPHQASLEETMACGFGVCVGCAVPVRADLLPGTGSAPGGIAYARVCTEGPVLDGDEVVWG